MSSIRDLFTAHTKANYFVTGFAIFAVIVAYLFLTEQGRATWRILVWLSS